MKSYYELLQDPRWQKKRLEIMKEKDFRCQECGIDDAKLNVHHGCYIKGLFPWDYNNEYYHCLCDKCHEMIHNAKEKLNIATADLSIGDIHQLIGFSLGLWSTYQNSYRVKLDNYEEIMGFASYVKANTEDIADYISNFNGWVDGESVNSLVKTNIEREKNLYSEFLTKEGVKNGRRKNVKKGHINKQKTSNTKD